MIWMLMRELDNKISVGSHRGIRREQQAAMDQNGLQRIAKARIAKIRVCGIELQQIATEIYRVKPSL